MSGISPRTSYWELEDYTALTKNLREVGIPIRLLKKAGNYHIYVVAGHEVHVYRNITSLRRYRIPFQCKNVYAWSGKRFIWLTTPYQGEVQPWKNGSDAAFSINGRLHLVTRDTSVAGFTRLVGALFSRYLCGVKVVATP